MRKPLLLLAFAIAGCGGSSDTAPTPPAPTNVTIVSASIKRVLVQNVSPYLYADSIFVHLHNSGGAGSYYIDWWGTPYLGGPFQKLSQGNQVTVSSGYDESLVFVASPVPYLVYGFRVQSVPTNTAVATQSACYQQDPSNGICP